MKTVDRYFGSETLADILFGTRMELPFLGRSDAESLRSDWNDVGGCVRDAMNEVGKQTDNGR